jgi:hypothetical protein
MSQIPFVDRLGDALEAAAADHTARQRRVRRRVRRAGTLALAAVLAVAGTVTAAELLSEPERLAATEVDCLYDPATGGGVGIHPGAQDPVAACRAFLAGPGKTLVNDGSLPAGAATPLVACVRSDLAKVVVIAGSQGACERHRLDPLPGAYDPAREKVAKLERDLRAIEASAACIPPKVLARRVQALLDRSGWTGWRATLRPDLSDGPCGHVLSLSEGGRRTLELVPDSRQLLVVGEQPQAAVDLLSRLSQELAEESVTRCLTADALKARVRQRLAPTGRKVSFRVAEALPGKYDDGGAAARYGDGRATARYAAGCAVLEKLGPAANGRDLVALIDQKD